MKRSDDKKNALKADRAELENQIELAGGKISGGKVNCFLDGHEDKSASGGIFERDGVWLFKCQKCDKTLDVFGVWMVRTGRSFKEAVDDLCPDYSPKEAPKEKKPPKKYKTFQELSDSVKWSGRSDGTFIYKNPELDHLLYAFRYIPKGSTDSKDKKMKLGHRSNGCFVMTGIPDPQPIYKQEWLVQCEAAVVFEGEKCVKLFESLNPPGYAGTTSPMGFSCAAKADWSPLSGKDVTIWPDNDDCGHTYAKTVIAKLQELEEPPSEIHLIDPSRLGLKEKDDIAEFIALSPHNALERVMKVITDAPLIEGDYQRVMRRLEDRISGEFGPIKWPWGCLSHMTKALYPGTITILCGNAGATKSFFLLESLVYWHIRNIKVAIFEMEEDKEDHLDRAVAQLEQNSKLLDDEWIKSNSDEARAATSRHRAFLDSFGLRMTDAQEKNVDINDVEKWIENKAKSGCRIIAVDPITAATVSGDRWKVDQEFILNVKAIARKYKTSVILVTHPIKNRSSVVSLSDMAGGTAYERFTQTALWIECHYENKSVDILCNEGLMPCHINRSLHLKKVRRGKGGGLVIGYNFSPDTLTFEEMGIISKKTKG